MFSIKIAEENVEVEHTVRGLVMDDAYVEKNHAHRA